jgi:hypothetical protein
MLKMSSTHVDAAHLKLCGLICPHVIRVVIHLNVQQIPERYILHRWSAAATTPVPDPGANRIRFGVPGTNTLKYNLLCRKMNDLASEACTGDETYKVVSAMIEEAKKGGCCDEGDSSSSDAT